MEDNKVLLTQINLNLDRLIEREWPKMEKIIEGHEDRLRKLEHFEIRLDDFLPRLDILVNEIRKNSDSYVKLEEFKKLESQLAENKKELDSIKGYMWKSVGAISVLAFIIPIALKFV